MIDDNDERRTGIEFKVRVRKDNLAKAKIKKKESA